MSNCNCNEEWKVIYSRGGITVSGCKACKAMKVWTDGQVDIDALNHVLGNLGDEERVKKFLAGEEHRTSDKGFLEHNIRYQFSRLHGRMKDTIAASFGDTPQAKGASSLVVDFLREAENAIGTYLNTVFSNKED